MIIALRVFFFVHALLFLIRALASMSSINFQHVGIPPIFVSSISSACHDFVRSQANCEHLCQTISTYIIQFVEYLFFFLKSNYLKTTKKNETKLFPLMHFDKCVFSTLYERINFHALITLSHSSSIDEYLSHLLSCLCTWSSNWLCVCVCLTSSLIETHRHTPIYATCGAYACDDACWHYLTLSNCIAR